MGTWISERQNIALFWFSKTGIHVIDVDFHIGHCLVELILAVRQIKRHCFEAEGENEIDPKLLTPFNSILAFPSGIAILEPIYLLVK